MSHTLNIGIFQMQVVPEIEENRRKIFSAIDDLSGRGADVVILPEIFNCPYDADLFQKHSQHDDSELVREMGEASKKNNILLIGGSVPEKDGSTLYNTSYIFENGAMLGKHRKMHLFDINIPGKITFMESDTFSPGKEMTVLETGVGTIGVAICFDVRFPELFKMMAQKGAGMIFLPGAFNTVTGPLHWELSLRARAVDSQCFVAACSPALNDDLTYKAWGHSAVVNPMGEVLDMLDSSEGSLLVKINKNEIKETRDNLPLLKQTALI